MKIPNDPRGALVALLLLLAGCGADAPARPAPPVNEEAAEVLPATPAEPTAVAGTPGGEAAPVTSPATGAALGVTQPAPAPGTAPAAPPSSTAAPAAAPAVAPGAEPAAASAAAPSPGAAATPPPLATSGATSPTAPAPTAADYTLEPGKSTLYVQVFKSPDTLASGASHDHVVAATGWSGTVRWDPSAPSACKVDIRVPVSGLRPDEDAMRKRVGYEVMLSASQREKIGEQMRAASQLDAARFGDITFAATRCEAVGEQVKVSGSLTVHGVAKTVTSTMKIRGDGQSFSASGTFTAKATDFGFEPYSALLGALKNENEMKFTLDVRGARRP